MDWEIAVCKEMGWSWGDLLDAPEDVVMRIVELLRERQAQAQAMASE